MSQKLDIIGNLLSNCIMAAPEIDRNILAQALEDYFEEFPRTQVRGAMLQVFLDAMLEGSDARATYNRD